jgi:hypothetical protein
MLSEFRYSLVCGVEREVDMRTGVASLAIIVLTCALCGVPAGAQGSWPAGSWQGSCRSASVTGQTFSAECATRSGTWNRSSIDLAQCPSRLVGNNNGQLFCEGGGGRYTGQLPGGSWRNSCSGGRMRGTTFIAECNTGSATQHTEYDMRNCPQWVIANRNGLLFCEANGGGYGPGSMPGGSWQNSCNTPKWRRPILTAQCKDRNGLFIPASINVNQCPQRLVANRNGTLTCQI